MTRRAQTSPRDGVPEEETLRPAPDPVRSQGDPGPQGGQRGRVRPRPGAGGGVHRANRRDEGGGGGRSHPPLAGAAKCPVKARCRVAWWHAPGKKLASGVVAAGAGLQFLEMSEADRARLREFLRGVLPPEASGAPLPTPLARCGPCRRRSMTQTIGHIVAGREVYHIRRAERAGGGPLHDGAERGGGSVLEGDRLVGVLSERDIMGRVVARGLDLDKTPVGDVMTRDLVVARKRLPRGRAPQDEAGGLPAPARGRGDHLVGMVSQRTSSRWTSRKRTRRSAGSTPTSTRSPRQGKTVPGAVRVVLVRPETPQRRGAARVVRNTGLAGLDLVDPGDWRTVECWRTAWGARRC